MLDFQPGSKRCGPLAAIIHDELRSVPIPEKVDISPILDRRKVLDPLKQAKFQQPAIEGHFELKVVGRGRKHLQLGCIQPIRNHG